MGLRTQGSKPHPITQHRTYRQYNDIPESLGTACTVQSMVFGNLNDDSGTGAF